MQRLQTVPEFEPFDEDDWVESKEPLKARLDGTHGRSVVPFTPVGGIVNGLNLPEEARYDFRIAQKGQKGHKESAQNGASAARTAPGIKRRTPKQIKEDMPPTPRGCEWRRSDEGWNLWRYWYEPGETNQGKIKKSRYTGHLSHDAWQIMKEYDHERILSTIGQRLRRHGRG